MANLKQRPSIASKIVTVALTFTLPIGVLLFLVVANINEFIHFGVKEVQGNAYQRPLEALLQGLQEHQLALHGGADAADQLVAAKARVETAFAALADADQRLGVDLQFTEAGLAKRDRAHVRVANVRGEWNALAGLVAHPVPEVPAEIDAQYEHLVSDVRTMITHAGDTSNLILDPDLDSYYLMDATLLALPQTQDRIAKVTAYGRDCIRRGRLSPAERTQLAVHAALLQEADLDRIAASAQTALNEDANFYGVSESLQRNLPRAVADYKTATSRLIELTRELAAAEQLNTTAADFVAAGQQAREASFRLWEIADTELDALRQRRIAAYTSRRAWSLGLASVAVLIAIALSCAVTLSITRPLEKLVRTLGPGATLLAGSVERIAEASQRQTATPEEASIICEELNAHADDMRGSVRELESLVRGGAATKHTAA